MNKAIFFDIDGTLVSFRTHEIVPSAYDAIAALRKKGHKVFIATGRPLHLIKGLQDDSTDTSLSTAVIASPPMEKKSIATPYPRMNYRLCASTSSNTDRTLTHSWVSTGLLSIMSTTGSSMLPDSSICLYLLSTIWIA